MTFTQTLKDFCDHNNVELIRKSETKPAKRHKAEVKSITLEVGGNKHTVVSDEATFEEITELAARNLLLEIFTKGLAIVEK